MIIDNATEEQARGPAYLCNEAALAHQPVTSAQDVLDALHNVQSARGRLNKAERTLIDLARRHGISWPRIGHALGVNAAQAAQQHREQLGSRGPKPKD
jgi:hypothetical protein